MRTGKLPGPSLKRAVLGCLKEGTGYKDKNIGVGCDAGFGIYRKEFQNSGETESGGICQGNLFQGKTDMDGESGEIRVFALDSVLQGVAPVDLFFEFHRGANSILAAGGVPRWVTLTLMLPENFEEQSLRKLMRQADALCASRGIEILGGQTETLPGLTEAIVTFHFMGTAYREGFPLQSKPGKVRPGEAIVMSHFLAADLAGKWLVEERQTLEKRFCPAFLTQAEEKIFGGNILKEDILAFKSEGPNVDREGSGTELSALENGRQNADRGSGCDELLLMESEGPGAGQKEGRNTDFPSVRKTACLAMDFGVTAMHDIGEGGIFGALRELGEREGCGLSADLKKIPILQEVIELCELFDRNPYLTKSCGALLMVAPDPEGLVRILAEAGIPAAQIGHFTDDRKMTIHNGEEIRYLDHPQMDESWK